MNEENKKSIVRFFTSLNNIHSKNIEIIPQEEPLEIKCEENKIYYKIPNNYLVVLQNNASDIGFKKSSLFGEEYISFYKDEELIKKNKKYFYSFNNIANKELDNFIIDNNYLGELIMKLYSLEKIIKLEKNNLQIMDFKQMAHIANNRKFTNTTHLLLLTDEKKNCIGAAQYTCYKAFDKKDLPSLINYINLPPNNNTEENFIYGSFLLIAPNYRNKKIGSEFINIMQNIVINNNTNKYNKVFIHTSKNLNPIVFDIYKKRGFRITNKDNPNHIEMELTL